MTAPLNLTLKRGPSVWDDQPTAMTDHWRSYGIAAGALLATAALQPRTNHQWLLGLALGIVGTSLLAGRFSSTLQASAHQIRGLRGGRKDHVVDRASEDSFPASDPAQYV